MSFDNEGEGFGGDSGDSGDRGRGRGGGGYGGRGGGRGGFGRGGGGGGYGGPREMHKATCSDCGNECEVPFKPIEGRPVYCKDCYVKHKKF